MMQDGPIVFLSIPIAASFTEDISSLSLSPSCRAVTNALFLSQQLSCV